LPYETSAEELTLNDACKTSVGVNKGIAPNDGTLATNLAIPGIADPFVTLSAVPTEANSMIYQGHQHIIANDSADTAVVVKYSIPLSVFKNTLLAIDRDQYFGNQSFFLNITWDKYDAVGFASAAAAKFLTPTTTTATISNLVLHLAIETNPIAIQAAKSPKSYPIPYVYMNKYTSTLTAGGSASYSARFTRSHGSYLKKIYFTCFAPEVGLRWYDNAMFDLGDSNTGAGLSVPAKTFPSKVASFYSTLNNARLQQFNPDVSKNEDYKLLLPYLKGSTVSRSRAYYQKWAWVENFEYRRLDYEDKEGSFLEGGFDLTEDAIYAFNFTTGTYAGDLIQTSYAVCQRTLTLSADGSVSLM
jgi:hypothetical protein